MNWIEILGWSGFAILVMAWIPQTLNTLRAGKTDMSMSFILMYAISSLLLTLYSILTVDQVFMALNGLLTLGSGINLFYKLFPRRTDG